MADIFREGDLLHKYPLWVLNNPASLMDFARLDGPDGEAGCPVFTRPALADEYRADNPGHEGWLATPVTSRTEMFDLVTLIKQLGFTHVVYVFGSGSGERAVLAVDGALAQYGPGASGSAN